MSTSNLLGIMDDALLTQLLQGHMQQQPQPQQQHQALQQQRQQPTQPDSLQRLLPPPVPAPRPETLNAQPLLPPPMLTPEANNNQVDIDSQADAIRQRKPRKPTSIPTATPTVTTALVSPHDPKSTPRQAQRRQSTQQDQAQSHEGQSEEEEDDCNQRQSSQEAPPQESQLPNTTTTKGGKPAPRRRYRKTIEREQRQLRAEQMKEENERRNREATRRILARSQSFQHARKLRTTLQYAHHKVQNGLEEQPLDLVIEVFEDNIEEANRSEDEVVVVASYSAGQYRQRSSTPDVINGSSVGVTQKPSEMANIIQQLQDRASAGASIGASDDAGSEGGQTESDSEPNMVIARQRSASLVRQQSVAPALNSRTRSSTHTNPISSATIDSLIKTSTADPTKRPVPHPTPETHATLIARAASVGARLANIPAGFVRASVSASPAPDDTMQDPRTRRVSIQLAPEPMVSLTPEPIIPLSPLVSFDILSTPLTQEELQLQQRLQLQELQRKQLEQLQELQRMQQEQQIALQMAHAQVAAAASAAKTRQESLPAASVVAPAAPEAVAATQRKRKGKPERIPPRETEQITIGGIPRSSMEQDTFFPRQRQARQESLQEHGGSLIKRPTMPIIREHTQGLDKENFQPTSPVLRHEALKDTRAAKAPMSINMLEVRHVQQATTHQPEKLDHSQYRKQPATGSLPLPLGITPKKKKAFNPTQRTSSTENILASVRSGQRTLPLAAPTQGVASSSMQTLTKFTSPTADESDAAKRLTTSAKLPLGTRDENTLTTGSLVRHVSEHSKHSRPEALHQQQRTQQQLQKRQLQEQRYNRQRQQQLQQELQRQQQQSLRRNQQFQQTNGEQVLYVLEEQNQGQLGYQPQVRKRQRMSPGLISTPRPVTGRSYLPSPAISSPLLPSSTPSLLERVRQNRMRQINARLSDQDQEDNKEYRQNFDQWTSDLGLEDDDGGDAEISGQESGNDAEAEIDDHDEEQDEEEEEEEEVLLSGEVESVQLDFQETICNSEASNPALQRVTGSQQFSLSPAPFAGLDDDDDELDRLLYSEFGPDDDNSYYTSYTAVGGDDVASAGEGAVGEDLMSEPPSELLLRQLSATPSTLALGQDYPDNTDLLSASELGGAATPIVPISSVGDDTSVTDLYSSLFSTAESEVGADLVTNDVDFFNYFSLPV